MSTVDAAAIHERHCPAAISGIVISLQHALRLVAHILNTVFDSNIAIIASVFTADNNSSSYHLTGLFCNFVHFVVSVSMSTEFI